MRSNPGPHSVCTPDHVPKSRPSAKVSSFTTCSQHSRFRFNFDQISVLHIPVVAASVVRRSVAAAAVAVAAAVGARVAMVGGLAAEPDTDIVAFAGDDVAAVAAAVA